MKRFDKSGLHCHAEIFVTDKRIKGWWIMADGYFVSTSDVEQLEMLPGVHRRTIATTDEAMLCQFFLEKDSTVPTHHHMNDQVGYVISGKVEMTIGGEARALTQGDSYAIPGGIPHSARALEDSWVIDAFSPPREDYRTEAR
jgi:quercetin dioxygenase-like cupin family protein